MSKTKVPFDDLPLIPSLIADVVATRPYDGTELSDRLRSQSEVNRIEMLRSQLTPEQRREFCELVDKRCRAAYDANADYFMKCIRAKGDRGRDQLYIWVQHWLASYLSNPVLFRKTVGQP